MTVAAEGDSAMPGMRGTIYILCPAHLRTGGPEALHQLGHALVRLGHDARMVYIDGGLSIRLDEGGFAVPDLPDAVHPDYLAYGVKRDWRVDDRPGNAVVFPEVWSVLLPWIRQARPYWWWLSVDNALPALEHMGGLAFLRGSAAVHLCQSRYARDWLAGHGIAGQPLSDHIAQGFHDLAAMAPQARVRRVLYSPKGRDAVAALRRRAPELDWVELSGFSTAEMQALFHTSLLYVDLGHHPGKDRMPREAALLGCCVITGRRGSAGNAEDVPIPPRYKFGEDRLARPLLVLATIRNTMAWYDRRIADFAAYRRVIAGEREALAGQVELIFGKRPPER
jgi:hypothetical protein